MNVRKNDIVMIRFLDHAEDSIDPIEFVVYGRLAKVDKNYYTIVCWDMPECEDLENPNLKLFSILRKAIKEINKLYKRKT